VDANGYPQSSVGFSDGSQHGICLVTGTIQERSSITASTKFTTDRGTVTELTPKADFSTIAAETRR
jgi:hypothetical protein